MSNRYGMADNKELFRKVNDTEQTLNIRAKEVVSKINHLRITQCHRICV